MTTDLTFITNEENQNLLERFRVLIKDTRFFDVLVGYFYSSGFYHLHSSLKDTEKIRILIGIGTDRSVFNLIHQSRRGSQLPLQFSHAEVKEGFSRTVTSEMENSEDDRMVEAGVYKFLDWLKSGKMEIRAYPNENIHAKIYIMTFAERDRDKGRVITGSSNFSRGGLIANLEFNVELKNRADYEYALAKFNDLGKFMKILLVKRLESSIYAFKNSLRRFIRSYEIFLEEYKQGRVYVSKKHLPLLIARFWPSSRPTER
jgi:HKD family nuclease